MKTKLIFGTIVLMFVLILPINTSGQNGIKTYFNDAADKVKATEDASAKREILNESFQNMSKALDKVESFGLISKEDRAGINNLKTKLQENQDELAGSNGFERVPDAQLNSFSDYVVQNMEQADQFITISVVTLLLILILVVLIL